MIEARQYWKGTVFPHVEYLDVFRLFEVEEIPIEFWREYLLKVIKVRYH